MVPARTQGWLDQSEFVLGLCAQLLVLKCYSKGPMPRLNPRGMPRQSSPYAPLSLSQGQSKVKGIACRFREVLQDAVASPARVGSGSTSMPERLGSLSEVIRRLVSISGPLVCPHRQFWPAPTEHQGGGLRALYAWLFPSPAKGFCHRFAAESATTLR